MLTDEIEHVAIDGYGHEWGTPYPKNRKLIAEFIGDRVRGHSVIAPLPASILEANRSKNRMLFEQLKNVN